ncbi:MAG: hypothetical protein HY909_00130 [Deltaproteobacteria bacterium]|nr:hypothetical protein [Deltaproteobacteria bacterium]
MSSSYARSGMLFAGMLALGGCYGGPEGEALGQTADAIKAGDRFRHKLPGNWGSALTGLLCASKAGPTTFTVTVGLCTMTYMNDFCRRMQNEEGGWDCICDSHVVSASEGCSSLGIGQILGS